MQQTTEFISPYSTVVELLNRQIVSANKPVYSLSFTETKLKRKAIATIITGQMSISSGICASTKSAAA